MIALLIWVFEIRHFCPFSFHLEERSALPFDSRYTLTEEGVKLASVLNIAPSLLSHRTSAMKPAPTSNIFPEASGPSGWERAATKGATNSG
jgi:hypothetical protein